MQDIVGKRIRLLDMPGDPDPIPVGSEGRVRRVLEFQGRFQLTIDWDESVGRSLDLVCPPDKIDVLDTNSKKDS